MSIEVKKDVQKLFKEKKVSKKFIEVQKCSNLLKFKKVQIYCSSKKFKFIEVQKCSNLLKFKNVQIY